MIDAEIRTSGSRAGLTDARDSMAECQVCVFSRGNDYASLEVELRVDKDVLLKTSQKNFHEFCARAIRVGSRQWSNVASDIGMTLKAQPVYETVEQNLIKAGLFVALWLEPHLISYGPSDLGAELLDRVIVDYTVQRGASKHIYFPPEDVLRRAPRDALQRLYDLRLLCRLWLRVGQRTIDRYFVPLVAPGVLVARFDTQLPNGGVAYKTWQSIRTRMRARLSELSGAR